MNTFKILTVFCMSFLLMAMSTTAPSDERIKIRITTNFGEMIVALYDETPLHRDNFVQLVEKGFYDSLQFHRIIEQFMIQGGDPTSRNADSTAKVGDGGPGYTLPAEIVDTIYHKRGALAAAREGDDVNPQRRSSGSQFYIVQGRVLNELQIADVNRRRVMMYGNRGFQQFLNDTANADFKVQFQKAKREKDKEKIKQLMADHQTEITAITDQFKLNSVQEEIYTTVGGAPHLDGGYTVFGELISGFEVLDSIASVRTNKKDRPLNPVIMEMEVISAID